MVAAERAGPPQVRRRPGLQAAHGRRTAGRPRAVIDARFRHRHRVGPAVLDVLRFDLAVVTEDANFRSARPLAGGLERSIRGVLANPRNADVVREAGSAGLSSDRIAGAQKLLEPVQCSPSHRRSFSLAGKLRYEVVVSVPRLPTVKNDVS